MNNQSARSKKVGDAVKAYIDLVLGHVGFSFTDVRYDGNPIPLEDLRTKAFWQKYAAGNADISFAYNNPYRGTHLSILTREELERATGESLDPSTWERTASASIDARITAAREDIAFLGKADVSDLMERSDLKVSRNTGAAVSFAERATSLLGSDLAVELVAQGYIDRYFTLYTSTFVGERLNANAMNFILKNVDTGSADFYFRLSPDEARAVLNERPRLAVREKCAYNFDFVDYLLKNEEASAETVLANLRRNGDKEKQFLQAYLSRDCDIVLFVNRLAREWPDVLICLVTDLDLADDRRLRAVDAALSGLADGTDYAADNDVSRYLLDNHTALKTFTDPDLAPSAKSLARVVDAAEIFVPELGPLSDAVCQAVVDIERFEVTRDNLLKAVRPSSDLSLNALRKASEHVYRRVISDLNSYLALLTTDERSVTDPESFVSITEDIDQIDRRSLPAIVGTSAEECRVPQLKGTAAGTWPALACHGRFPSEFDNIAAYVEQYGIDGNLAVVLAGGTIRLADDVEEKDKIELATELINSAEHLPSAELRATLLESLHLENFLPPSSVPVERGEWVGRLIAKRVISDDAESFALIPTDDWKGREYAIGASPSIASFISPEILAPSDLTRFLSSGKVPETLKHGVVERFTEFAVGADKDAVQALAAYAVNHNVQVSWADVRQAASAHVEQSLTLRLLQRFLRGANLEHLIPILEAIGGDYPALGAANGKRRRFANTAWNRALLERLKELGTVNTVILDGEELKVNMKRS